MNVKHLFWTLIVSSLSGCATTQTDDPFSGVYLGGEVDSKPVKNVVISRVSVTQWEFDWLPQELQNLGKTLGLVPHAYIKGILDKSVDATKIVCITSDINYPNPMLCKVPNDQPLRFINGHVDFSVPTGYAIVGGTPAGMVAMPTLKVK
jgi:hypothetical protein